MVRRRIGQPRSRLSWRPHHPKPIGTSPPMPQRAPGFVPAAYTPVNAATTSVQALQGVRARGVTPNHVRPDQRVWGPRREPGCQPPPGSAVSRGLCRPEECLPHRPTLADALAADPAVRPGVRPSCPTRAIRAAPTDRARGSRRCSRARAGSRKTAILGSRSQVSPPLSERKCSVSDRERNTVKNTGHRHFLTHRIY